MNLPKVRLRRKRVGVIGLYRSGKTVFLTSLINHLRNHDPARFQLWTKTWKMEGLIPKRKPARVKLAFEEEIRSPRFAPFPYQEYRNQLVEAGQWPQKTVGISEYRCRYYRSDWRTMRGELVLLDFPGERLADLTMAKASYEQWSDLIIGILKGYDEYRSHARTYLALLERRNLLEETILEGYRGLLLRLFLEFRPVITPSTFLLSQKGEWISRGDAPLEERARGLHLGLDASSQFAPMSLEARESHPGLAKSFTERYADYRSKVSLPLYRWMRSCDSLAVLVDVTAVLAGGVDTYKGTTALLESLVGHLRPGKGYFGVSWDFLSTLLAPLHGPINSIIDLDWHEIARVAFVATKADKVHDAQRVRLRDLVREMTSDLVASYQEKTASLKVEYFACAAARSTRSTPDGALQAFLGNGDQLSAYRPSDVPGKWPRTWQSGEYRFPNVQPAVPSRRDAPPDHLDLDKVADFLLA